mmetsp:Transcript_8708/g.32150  ORF Transcript_8708/g.32150 Transcript_8708/m.32150 type:complete len:99 (-) Transcript_8708:2042-2338(-)
MHFRLCSAEPHISPHNQIKKSTPLSPTKNPSSHSSHSSQKTPGNTQLHSNIHAHKSIHCRKNKTIAHLYKMCAMRRDPMHTNNALVPRMALEAEFSWE